tara:strand:- start:138 stop:455 length:318 start_codon:yes stop_codon:yes gene_type:complete
MILRNNNEKEGFLTVNPKHKYGAKNKNTKFHLNGIDYGTLLGKVNKRNHRLPGAGTLSWESDSVLKNEKLMPIMNLLYGRFCAPPKISEMGTYDIYIEQNEMIPN